MQNRDNRTIFQRIITLLAVMSVLSLSACVVTERGGIGEKKDLDKALEYSLQLARSYIADGDWDAAKRHLKYALKLDDESADVYEAMALVFQNTGEIELAEENYRKSIRLDPKSSRVRNNYAAFLYSLERYQEAAEQLEVVSKDTLYGKRALAMANLGKCYRKLEKWQPAEEAFRRAILLDRESVQLRYELANVYYHLGEFARSQQYYDAYRSKIKQQSPQGLLLGIRLADKFDNRNARSSYALALKNLYPTSNEYLVYKQEYGDDS